MATHLEATASARADAHAAQQRADALEERLHALELSSRQPPLVATASTSAPPQAVLEPLLSAFTDRLDAMQAAHLEKTEELATRLTSRLDAAITP